MRKQWGHAGLGKVWLRQSACGALRGVRYHLRTSCAAQLSPPPASMSRSTNDAPQTTLAAGVSKTLTDFKKTNLPLLTRLEKYEDPEPSGHQFSFLWRTIFLQLYPIPNKPREREQNTSLLDI